MNDLNFCKEAKALTDLWMQLPKEDGSLCPKKKDFSPVSLREHLKSVFMVERQDEDMMLVRVAGTSIRDYLGREITGENHFDIIPPEISFAYKEYYNNLTSHPCIGIVERTVSKHIGSRDCLTIVHFPLLDNNGEARFFVGTLSTERLPLDMNFISSGTTSNANTISVTYIDIGAGIPNSERKNPASA